MSAWQLAAHRHELGVPRVVQSVFCKFGDYGKQPRNRVQTLHWARMSAEDNCRLELSLEIGCGATKVNLLHNRLIFQFTVPSPAASSAARAVSQPQVCVQPLSLPPSPAKKTHGSCLVSYSFPSLGLSPHIASHCVPICGC